MRELERKLEEANTQREEAERKLDLLKKATISKIQTDKMVQSLNQRISDIRSSHKSELASFEAKKVLVGERNGIYEVNLQ